jgi:hypothetical protein
MPISRAEQRRRQMAAQGKAAFAAALAEVHRRDSLAHSMYPSAQPNIPDNKRGACSPLGGIAQPEPQRPKPNWKDRA